MTVKLSEEQVRHFRLRRSGLQDPFHSPQEVASALVGVQAQILPAAALSLWNRTTSLTHQRFEHLLYDERSLIKLWGQRGTLHLYPSEEWPLLHGALAGRKSWWERSIEKEGGDVAAYHSLIAELERILRERGTLGRSDLRASDLPIDEDHLSSWGGIFADLIRRGYACHAGQAGNEGRFAHRDFWLPELVWNPPSIDEANQELVRRYLHSYGPASIKDFAYWRGAKVTDARRWFAALEGELAEVALNGSTLLALRKDLDVLQACPPVREGWPVRMLYRFDPLLLAHKDKGWLVDERNYGRVWRPAGHIEGTLLEHGRIGGRWRYDRKGSGLVITLFPFVPLPDHARTAIEQQAGEIAAFFDLPLAELIWMPVQ